ADTVARSEGYDIVYIDDSGVELPTQPTEQQALQIILSRRVLFASNAIDITDELQRLMNNRYRAGANNRP
ncbi:MAG: hypothetical protein AAF235_08205, partial [Planctomycetota bacterium]